MVQEMDAQGRPQGNPRTYSIPQEVLSVNIGLTGGSDNYNLFPAGGLSDRLFSRLEANSSANDLGWMIDFAGAEPRHGRIKRLKGINSPGRVGVTLARIRHSLFFTQRPGRDSVRLAPKDAGPFGADSFELGRINEEIGAHLLASRPGDLELVFEPAGSFQNLVLPYDENHTYQLAITNMDMPKKLLPAEQRVIQDGYVKGDFHHFYDIVEVDGTPHDLWAQPRTVRAIDGDCNPIGGRFRTLQPLIEPEPQADPQG
jgi:hypothetical protein